MRRIDWAQIKTRYINGNGGCTFDTLASEFGVRPDSVRRRASREGWTAARQARADAVVREATAKSVLDGAAELARLNYRHLSDANEAEEKIMAMLRRNDNDPQDARTLLAALSDCQKISRLALGASPSNQIVSSPPPVEDFSGLELLTTEELETFQALLHKAGIGPVQ